MPMNTRHRIVRGLLAALWLTGTLVCGGCAQPTTPDIVGTTAETSAANGIRYWLVCRQYPRPLRIHHLQVDLANPRVEVAAVLAADPDGDGPATATLESPLAMAQHSSALALVNANPWQGLADVAGKRSTDWHEGMAVQVLGLAAAQGAVRSLPRDPSNCSVWLDAQGKLRIGHPDNGAEVRQGVAGFLQLVQDGRVMQAAGGPIHPRTALGMDASGRYLYLVVVDGRQAGYSEGMSYFELSTYMRELGCHDAVNLDGGGSSVMILRSGDGRYRVVNDPSTKRDGVSVLRPIPVALVVRSRHAGPRLQQDER